MNSRSRLFAACLILRLPYLLLADETPLPGYVAGKDYADRSAAAVRALAASTPANPNYPKDAMPIYAARLQIEQDVDGTLKAIDQMMDAVVKTHDDPFNLHAILHAYCLDRDQYPPALRDKFRDFVARWYFTKPIGVSLNYELMRDGAGWLAAQEWPELRDRAGHDAAQIQSLCGVRLFKAMSETTLRNSSEYESPLYTGADLMALRMLAEFAREPRMQQAGRMTFESMLIHTAAHWHHGYLITSSGRAKHWFSNNTSPDAPGITTGMAYLLFGGDRPANIATVPQCFWLAHPGKTLPLDWLSAWQARLPETRSAIGAVWHPERKQVVRKTAWFTHGYGLASERNDQTPADSYHYKECRRTMLKWVSDKPSSSFTILQENRQRPHEKVANAFGYGENPYAQVMQHEGTLIGVYDVPADYGFHRLHAPFTTEGAIVLRKDRNGWIICHCGTMLFGFRFLGPAQSVASRIDEKLDLYQCDEPRGGWILETTPLRPFAGGGVEAELDRFADRLVTTTKVAGDATANPPRVTFTNLAARTLDLVWHPPEQPYSGQCVLDGKPLDDKAFPLLETQGALQAVDGPLVIDLPDRVSRTYDFQKWEVRASQRMR